MSCLVSVPPQQFITVDGGIVEVGAEVQFGIVDIVTMVKEVADHQDILRYGAFAHFLSPLIYGHSRIFSPLRYGAFAPCGPSPDVPDIRVFSPSSQIRGIRAFTLS
jgi:hypothetical protein